MFEQIQLLKHFEIFFLNVINNIIERLFEIFLWRLKQDQW